MTSAPQSRGVASFFQALDRKSLASFWSEARAGGFLIFSPRANLRNGSPRLHLT